MIKYVKGPAYKALGHFGKLNAPLVRSYIPNLVFWGAAAGGAVATFTEGVPLFQKTFYEKSHTLVNTGFITQIQKKFQYNRILNKEKKKKALLHIGLK